MGIRYCTIGLIQIVILRMASVSTLVGWEVRVSSVERVSSVGVTDVSSLVLAVLHVGILLFVVRVFLVVLRTVGLFHQRYKKLSWLGCFFRVIYCGTMYKVNSSL